MGGLAPGKLKSRRGWHSSPRRLHSAIPLFDPGFKNSLQEKLYQLYGAGDILIAIDSRRRGPLWSAKMAHSLTAADIQRLIEKGYSQAPVVVGNQVLGVFSFRSFARAIAKIGNKKSVKIEEIRV